MLRREQASTPLVGSSRTTVLEEPRNAMPTDSRRRRPPDRAPVRVCWCGVSPTSPRALKRERAGAGPPRLAAQSPCRHPLKVHSSPLATEAGLPNTGPRALNPEMPPAH